jgi:hypothetical protein
MPDEEASPSESNRLSQHTRTRRNVEKVDRLDSRSASGLGGAANQGPSWISENSIKLMIVFFILIVLGVTYMEQNGDYW